MKRVVSISLGTSKRNKTSVISLLGTEVQVERIGVDGDTRRFAQMFRELDGKVDAIGIGGADLHVWIDGRRYTFREIRKLVSGAKTTPVLDGSGLKNTLERNTIYELNAGTVPFAETRVLLTMAVDRFGMAKALSDVCPRVVFGDAIFGLGIPVRLRSYRAVRIIGQLLLPIITQLPFRWFYPIGKDQERRRPKFAWAFQEADVVCGDWHYIHRYCPSRLDGKTVITNTLRSADIAFLREAGVSKAITSTPNVQGESFGTNVMEAALVAVLGRGSAELTAVDYAQALDKLQWQPNIIELS